MAIKSPRRGWEVGKYIALRLLLTMPLGLSGSFRASNQPLLTHRIISQAARESPFRGIWSGSQDFP